MMPVDYSVLEKDFDCACDDVIKDLTGKYKSTYQAGGADMLNAFFDLIKTEFDNAAQLFITNNKLSNDAEGLRLITAIAKKHAKKCIDFYGQVR
ncbi:hypothetical protein Q766_12575 [Flavobacterium subsaxonicum WB 4.1-42 = DSM 21790]|uniref:Uncharacterized protein n=1 Tax=Flavobacterium subsaxonicum WB 4.1-42 = DSM 21790 TaxID=1121898 RepID=A0A0A2ML51_9FLAO|nr:hypothetical protein Q766_12575 [Flavobacterium subsaxonicum WB 4.1-42 = DSM 21790]